MDDFSNFQKIELQFLQVSNELLSKCKIAENFIYQWLEILEDQFDLSEVYLYLPCLQGRKTYASHGVLEDRHKLKNNTIFSNETIIDDYYFHPIVNVGRKSFFCINEDSIRSNSFKIFKKYLPFFIGQIVQTDDLYRKNKICNFNLAVKDFLLEPSSIQILLENMKYHMSNDHVFLYNIKKKEYFFESETSKIINKYQNNFDFILKQAIGHRYCYQNEDFHDQVKSLILYPIFNKDDMPFILGSFSENNPIIQTSDLHMMADFACDSKTIKFIEKVL
ncbi:MAG: hypothetical protein COB02_16280 [Candidatus Cloacimonadota bacterium]|nr:MAG: hypothetical protein COB02_16280 [Candidatus Cloacimonadota bacterium]